MSLAHLWIPIVVSAVLVFIASSIIHMAIKWHRSEFRGFPQEESVRAAIRASGATPGQYLVPYCADMKDMGTPEMRRKFEEGPIAYVTLRAPQAPTMGKPLALWFVYSLAVSAIAGYVAAKALPAGASVTDVCRVAGTIAFVAYTGGSVQSGIWMGKPWRSVAIDALDGAIYGLVTGAAFGWLWR